VNKLRELYEYRDLIWTLSVKELKVQYRNSVLGFLWSLLNPLLMMLIFSFVFTNVLKFGIKDFPVFLLCGLLPWNFFNAALVSATGSIVANGSLIKKVYFPREILPLSSVLANLFNFLLSLIVLFVFLVAYGYHFWVWLIILPVIIVVETLCITGLSLLLAGLNVYYRDIQYIVSVGLMALFYATPIIYTFEKVKASYWMTHYPWLLTIYNLNPMTSIVNSYRSILFQIQLPSLSSVLYALGITVVLLVLGYVVFRRLEPAFADEV
jgi:lipopolysaccharide transport system permease protein